MSDNIEYTGETLTITPNPTMRNAVLAAAGLRCTCPGDCACKPRFTGDYRSINPPCGCRLHTDESGAMRLDSLAFLATVALVSVPVTLVTVFVGRLAGAVAGVA